MSTPYLHQRGAYIGCNQKWIAEQTGTSIAMIQDHYGRYIRDDGDALLRIYVEQPKLDEIEEKTETFPGTFSSEVTIGIPWWSPTGIELETPKKKDEGKR